MPRKTFALVGVVVVLVCIASQARASFPVSFNLVADESTAIPGGTGNFALFGLEPAIGGGAVAFRGHGTNAQTGIYSTHAGLHAVADRSMPVPGGSENFFAFPAFSIEGGVVAFRSHNSSFSYDGIYKTTGGPLTVVADRNTLQPNNTGTFGQFREPAIDGGTVTFWGQGPGLRGIYTDMGGLQTVADDNTVFMGSPLMLPMSTPDISGHKVVFATGVIGSGQILVADGGLTSAVTTSDVVPGLGETFTRMRTERISGDDIAFQGMSTNSNGEYKRVAGELMVIANTLTPIPEGEGDFTDFRLMSFDQGNAVILGIGDNQVGLYADHSGTLEKLIAAGDILFGKTVADLNIGRNSLDGDRIAFWAQFDDGTAGIYTATVPEPTTVSLVAFALAAGLIRRKRSKARVVAG